MTESEGGADVASVPELAAPPGPPGAPEAAAQPLAVYLLWLVVGWIAAAWALPYPVGLGLESLAQAFPKWSQVAGAGALVVFALCMLERAGRDRKALGHVLNLCAGALVVLALRDPLLEGYPTQSGWYAVSALACFGLLYLLFLEDWAAGRSGAHFQTLASTLRDLATARWWFWFSKAALTLRARRKLLEGARREREEQERSARKIAEDRAATAAAERSSGEDALAAARAAEAAATAQRMSATEQQRADEASRRAADAQARRSDSESRSAAARKQIEELSRDAESAALERTRMRAEQLEAERRFLEAAVSAHAAAEIAVQKGVEANRALQVFERIHDEELAQQLVLTVAATDSPEAGFALHVDPGSASAKDMAELLAAFAELYRAQGRTGLQFEWPTTPRSKT